jgi:hypothetical protein
MGQTQKSGWALIYNPPRCQKYTEYPTLSRRISGSCTIFRQQQEWRILQHSWMAYSIDLHLLNLQMSNLHLSMLVKNMYKWGTCKASRWCLNCGLRNLVKVAKFYDVWLCASRDGTLRTRYSLPPCRRTINAEHQFPVTNKWFTSFVRSKTFIESSWTYLRSCR